MISFIQHVSISMPSNMVSLLKTLMYQIDTTSFLMCEALMFFTLFCRTGVKSCDSSQTAPSCSCDNQSVSRFSVMKDVAVAPNSMTYHTLLSVSVHPGMNVVCDTQIDYECCRVVVCICRPQLHEYLQFLPQRCQRQKYTRFTHASVATTH